MNERILWLSLTLISVLLLSGYTAIGSAIQWVIPNQDHMIVESIGDPETVDPAWAYESDSAALISNVYDTLVFFDRDSVSNFVPSLATDWLIEQPPHPDAPAGTNQTWYFKIREGVKFQDGSTLTTEDVEYSFERAMVQDRSGGPVWMFNEPLIGEGWPDKSGWAEAAGNPIDTAVESNTTHVWFNLAKPYPPFMQILCQSWASILSKDWCSGIAGEWDGDWTDWKSHADPTNSPLDVAGDLMMGTGPYMLDYWDHGVEYSIVAFNAEDTWPTGYDPAGPDPPHAYEHWQQWPAPHCSGYLRRVTDKVNYEWGVRKANFEAGVADSVYVPTAYLPQMILNWPTTWDADARMRLDAGGNPEYYATGIRCLPGVPTLSVAAFHFNVDIPAASPYVGTGSFPDGIPLDFWGDRRIRQAFAYCFDYDQFLEDMYWGEASQPGSPVIEGLLYHNPANPKYSLDLVKAKELFMAASADPASPAYGVWDQGFTVTMIYNTGNVARETTVTMMATGVGNLFALGPDGLADTGDEAGGDANFIISSVPWPTYLGDLVSGILPFFVYGWLADYPDPHNLVVPYMHTYGDFSYFQHYSNSTIDALIEQGIATPDGPERENIYHTLQLMYFQDCPSVCTSSGYGRHWERDWVQGWYHNPIYPGNYYYHLWKGIDADINGDHVVNILDAGKVSAHWYPGPPVGPSGYDPIADIMPRLQYNGIPKVWDSELQAWIPHPSIGAVDLFDAALVSYQWLDWKSPIPPPPPPVPNGTVIAAPDIMDETLTPGNTFSIDITVANVTDMWGYEFTLSYDTSILTAISYSSHPIFPFPWSYEINDPEGYVRVAYSRPLASSVGFDTVDPFPIGTVEFIVDAFGCSPLDLHDSIISDIYGDPIPRAEVDGSFCNAKMYQEDYLAKANEILDESKSYIDTAPIAKNLKNDMTVKIGNIQDEIEVALKQKINKAREMIHDAKHYISDAKKHELEVSEAESVLKRAEVEFANGKFELALRDALNARQMAIDLLKTVVPDINPEPSEEIWESFCEAEKDKFETILTMLENYDGFIDDKVTLDEIPSDVGEAIKAYNADVRICIEEAKGRLTVPL